MDWKKFLAGLATQVLASVSTNLLLEIKAFAVSFRERAAATTNPWDDVLADLMCGLLGIPKESKLLN